MSAIEHPMALAGRASTPVAQLPAASVSSSPWQMPELSTYWPTAPQFPAEAHEIERRETHGAAAAFAGGSASAPAPQVPPASVSSKP